MAQDEFIPGFYPSEPVNEGQQTADTFVNEAPKEEPVQEVPQEQIAPQEQPSISEAELYRQQAEFYKQQIESQQKPPEVQDTLAELRAQAEINPELAWDWAEQKINQRAEELIKPHLQNMIDFKASQEEEKVKTELAGKGVDIPFVQPFANQILAGCTPEQKMQPGFIRSVYDRAITDNLDKIIGRTKEVTTADTYQNIQNKQKSSTSLKTGTPPQSGKTLTEEQRKTAKNYGMTEAEYSKFMKVS